MNAPAGEVEKRRDGEIHVTWLERFGSGFQADILAVLRNKFPDSFSKIEIEYINKISRIKDLLYKYFYFKEVEFIEVLSRAKPNIILRYWRIILEGDELSAANALANLLYNSDCSLTRVQLGNRVVLGVIPMTMGPVKINRVTEATRVHVGTVTAPGKGDASTSLM